jgi:hypothetical protein
MPLSAMLVFNVFGPKNVDSSSSNTKSLKQIPVLIDTNVAYKNQATYIEELTGTVIFDILDCVDSMEILFIREERETFPKGMDDAIIAIALGISIGVN